MTHPLSSLSAAAHEGRQLAVLVTALALANALIAIGLDLVERRVHVPHRMRLAGAAALVLAVLAAIASVFVVYGGPVRLTQRAYDSFTAPLPSAPTNLNSRLFSLSNNGRVTLWKTGWADAKDHRLLGSGAGTFEPYWLRHRRDSAKARDAHSLYVETLAELGPVGLTLLLGVLALPVAAAVRARRKPLVPAAFGAYLAFVAHAGIDWDWEMTAVTLTALFCGVALIVAARKEDSPSLSRRSRLLLVTVTFALASFAFVGLIGNGKLADGAAAADSRQWAVSESRARAAMAWMPWSGEPWRLAGEAELARGHLDAARSSFESAISKDRRNWELWLDLSLASRGDTRRNAALRALDLNPFDPEVVALAQRLHLARADLKASQK